MPVTSAPTITSRPGITDPGRGHLPQWFSRRDGETASLRDFEIKAFIDKKQCHPERLRRILEALPAPTCPWALDYYNNILGDPGDQLQTHLNQVTSSDRAPTIVITLQATTHSTMVPNDGAHLEDPGHTAPPWPGQPPPTRAAVWQPAASPTTPVREQSLQPPVCGATGPPAPETVPSQSTVSLRPPTVITQNEASGPPMSKN